ncbi:GDP-mannose 4,6-dehydratase [Azospirillum sp. YIM DDC1]|uniref:GDP-mannose 4,6-dehydratase n=1 Tax=Azospirillum aestuarii TaxID=2802052 RepID=A0ABS1I706_9PROT|nr:GDP-mannose 4,6-dehydratase [Azospirillum aestuarii]MBK4722833.1 GDP-mannose 4,6-dehydratase [Azospirillum aestuarii]
MSKVALILGVGGQDGAYLTKLLLAKGYEIHGTSRDDQVRAFDSLQSLGIRDQIRTHSLSLNDFRSVFRVLRKVRPDEIYNLAGQSSVGLSFDQPVETFESIAVGTLNILECLKMLEHPAKLFNAGSSECFGNTPEPANESTPFHPRSPYAAAKAASFWTVANYREAYNLHACSGILFNHESPLRPQRFVTRKIVSTAVRIANGQQRERLRLGNISIHRDWGWAPEYVDAMWRVLQHETPEDFVIATGHSASLKEFVAEVFRAVGLDWSKHVDVDSGLFRPSEIDRSVGNPDKARTLLNWKASMTMPDIATALVSSELARVSAVQPA